MDRGEWLPGFLSSKAVEKTVELTCQSREDSHCYTNLDVKYWSTDVEKTCIRFERDRLSPRRWPRPRVRTHLSLGSRERTKEHKCRLEFGTTTRRTEKALAQNNEQVKYVLCGEKPLRNQTRPEPRPQASTRWPTKASPCPHLALSPSFARGIDRMDESGVAFCSFGICSEEPSLV